MFLWRWSLSIFRISFRALSEAHHSWLLVLYFPQMFVTISRCPITSLMLVIRSSFVRSPDTYFDWENLDFKKHFNEIIRPLSASREGARCDVRGRPGALSSLEPPSPGPWSCPWRTPRPSPCSRHTASPPQGLPSPRWALTPASWSPAESSGSWNSHNEINGSLILSRPHLWNTLESWNIVLMRSFMSALTDLSSTSLQ